MDITNYMKMIHKVAHAKHNQFGIEFEELVGRGTVLFYECQARFDESKGTSFGSFFYMVLQHEMVVWQRGFGKVYKPIVDTELINSAAGNYAQPHVIAEFKEMLSHLSPDGKEAVRMIFDCPEDIVTDAIGRGKLMMGNVRRKLKEAGWNNGKMSGCFKEIRAALAA